MPTFEETDPPTSAAPTTKPPTSGEPTSAEPTSPGPTSAAPTTNAPTSAEPTTNPPTTPPPTVIGPTSPTPFPTFPPTTSLTPAPTPKPTSTAPMPKPSSVPPTPKPTSAAPTNLPTSSPTEYCIELSCRKISSTLVKNGKMTLSASLLQMQYEGTPVFLWALLMMRSLVEDTTSCVEVVDIGSQDGDFVTIQYKVYAEDADAMKEACESIESIHVLCETDDIGNVCYTVINHGGSDDHDLLLLFVIWIAACLICCCLIFGLFSRWWRDTGYEEVDVVDTTA